MKPGAVVLIPAQFVRCVGSDAVVQIVGAAGRTRTLYILAANVVQASVVVGDGK